MKRLLAILLLCIPQGAGYFCTTPPCEEIRYFQNKPYCCNADIPSSVWVCKPFPDGAILIEGGTK